MFSQNFIINKCDEPFIFDGNKNLNEIKNLLFIDKTINEKILFYNSTNSDTYPIIYSNYSNSLELKKLLESNFINIERIGFVMHNACLPYKKFINNEYFFTESDIIEPNNNLQSNNLKFLIDIIGKFKVKKIDFLACKLLLNDQWQKYFNLLNRFTGVIVGASDDNTGNIKYGGDWILETTGEDIQNIYWTENIINYSSSLAITQLSYQGGNLYLKQDTPSSYISYSINNLDWTSIDTNWPLEVTNTHLDPSSNILTVIFTTDITLTNLTVGNLANFYIRTCSQFITLTGLYNSSSHIITIAQELSNGTNNSDFAGLISNSGDNAFSNITIENIGITIADTVNVNNSESKSLFTISGGWICREEFAVKDGNEVVNCFVKSCYSEKGRINNGQGGIVGLGSSGTIIDCNSTCQMNDYAGGIFGSYSHKSARAIKCYSTGDMGSNDGGAGGIFGGYSLGIAEYCNSSGMMGGACGGIFGAHARGVAINCYSTGFIGPRSGGIFGARTSAFAINCYSTGTIGDVVSSSYGGSGGIVGYESSGTTINCYSTGNIQYGSGGIFGMGPGIIKIKNCYSSGKILHQPVSDATKYAGTLIADPDEEYYKFFTKRYVPGVTVENSYSENTSSLTNYEWNDSNATTYLISELGSTWITGNNVSYTFSIPANSRTITGFSLSTPKTFGDPSFNVTTPTSSTGTGTITYLSNFPTIASINNSTGEISLLGGGETVTIISSINESNGFRSYTLVDYLLVHKATRTLSGYTIPNQLFISGLKLNPSPPIFSVGDGLLEYASQTPSTATINSSTGEVTIISSGIATISVVGLSTLQYDSTSSLTTTFTIGTSAILYFGQSLAPSGIYYISNSDSSFNGKTVQVASDGSITVLTNSNVYTTNTQKAYVNDSQLTEGNLILTKSGLKYTLDDGITWN